MLCEWFSLNYNESTDISDTALLPVIVRMTFSDVTVKEQLSPALPIKRLTKGDDSFYNLFISYLTSISMPLYKLSAIATDGAPASDRQHQWIHSISDSSFAPYPIFHQRSFLRKGLSFQNVKTVILKIIQYVPLKSLQH